MDSLGNTIGKNSSSEIHGVYSGVNSWKARESYYTENKEWGQELASQYHDVSEMNRIDIYEVIQLRPNLYTYEQSRSEEKSKQQQYEEMMERYFIQ